MRCAPLGSSIRCNAAAFNAVNLPRNRIIGVTNRPFEFPLRLAPVWDETRGSFPFPPSLSSIWEKYSGQHPLVRYVGETGDGQAVKISDFLSPAEYHRLELYREFYQHLGAEDQMCITIRSDHGFLIALAFNRARRDFSESDRVKLNLVRPHLLQAYANAEELTGHLEERDDLQTALRETGHGLISVDAQGTAAHATPGALECLGRYFPGPRSGLLPKPVLAWLRDERTEPLTARTATSRLIVRAPRRAPRPLLLLSEENELGQTVAARLTVREHEVLRWLAEGKSNRDIAIILGVASGTIKMHVEHILAKLGVDNRTAASALAREAGLLSRRERKG